MELQTALTLALGQHSCPAVTTYDLGKLIFRIYKEKKFQGEKISRIQKDAPNRSDYKRLVGNLMDTGILQRNHQVNSKEVFFIVGKDASLAEEIACCIDPFSYISHLSAMAWHGLTDLIPKILFVSSPPAPKWGAFALERMCKDLGEDGFAIYQNEHLPLLRKLRLESILRKTVNRYSGLHMGAFTSVRNRPLRVSTIGRTFLDMIREPDLCGGIYHVLDVYEEHAARYLQLIVDDINRHGTKIDKVRTGYILDERCGLAHPSVDGWLAFVQRGGSRKLYANAAYTPDFSEKWCLSINLEG